MNIQARKRNVAPGSQELEDGDFVQLRKVREKKRNLQVPIPTHSDIKPNDNDQGKPQPPKTKVKEVENLRDKLFKAVDDSDIKKLEFLLSELTQHKSITIQSASHPETNENIWHYALSHDKPKVRNYLLDKQDVSLIMSHHEIQRSGLQGEHNALHILIEKNDIETAKRVLKKISSNDNKLKMMETRTAVKIEGQRPRLFSCLHLAAYYGQADLVNFFLDQGMDVDHLNDKNDTALVWAARWGHYDTVNSLIHRGAKPEIKNDKGSTALYWAVRYEHAETVKLLLDKGEANPNQERKLGLVAPLIVASAYGNNEIVKLLLSNQKCEVNIRIRGGETPIHHAAREGEIAVLTTLLEHKAQLDDKDELGDTPLLLAAQNNHIDVVNKLIGLGANVFHRNHEGNDIWNYAMNSDDNFLLHTLMAVCLDKGIDMKARQPLCIAAASGRNDKIDFLLNSKEKPLATDTDGNTFLHHAAMNNKYDVIDSFHNSIPIDKQNGRNNTPLHIACSKGFDKTIMTLLKCKARADVKNSDGETPLHVAAYSKRISANTVCELVDYTIKMYDWESLNAKDNMGNNCLHVAGRFAKPDVLWEYRFVTFKDLDNDGNTPLHKAVRPGQPEALDKMLDIYETTKRDARINERSSARGETVLHLAAEEGLSQCLKRLIDLGADLSAKDADGNTVLHRLTRATVLNPRLLKRHMEVFEMIFERVVKWWCINKNIPYPGEDNRSNYLSLQKEASLYLMNEIYNTKGQSVLALSFNMGAADIISRLLMMPDVTMFEITNLGSRNYIFDVSRLTPLTNNLPKGRQCYSKVSPKEDEENLEENRIHGTGEVRLSGLEWLITEKVKSRATQILDLPPIKMIEKYYTSIVARTLFLLMFFHIIYMGIFTYVGVDLLGKLRDDDSAINSSDPETVLLYIIVPIEPAIIVIYVLHVLIRCALSDDLGRISKMIHNRDFLTVLSVLSKYIVLLTGVIYAALVIAWIVLFSVRYEFQDYVLAASLCIGWLFSISFTRGFKKIHYFYRMLLSIILRDTVRFIIIYLFVLFAFGCAFHVLFQISSDVVQDYKTLFDTLFLSFNMMVGMDELFDGTFERNMANVGRDVNYVKVFYLLYIILSTIILINLLIAMMNDSYSKIFREQKVTWRIDSVSLGVDIETSFPVSRLFAKISIEQRQDATAKVETTSSSSGHDRTTSGRWYVNVDADVVDEYTREHDIKNENTDVVNNRLEELEAKANDMQENTNKRLQQINDLLEKAVQR